MQHHLVLGPHGLRHRLPDDTDIEGLRDRINHASGPIELGMVTEDSTQVTLWLNPLADPWWSIESFSLD